MSIEEGRLKLEAAKGKLDETATPLIKIAPIVGEGAVRLAMVDVSNHVEKLFQVHNLFMEAEPAAGTIAQKAFDSSELIFQAMGSVRHNATDSALVATSTMAEKAVEGAKYLDQMRKKLFDAMQTLHSGVAQLLEYEKLRKPAIETFLFAASSKDTAVVSIDVYLEKAQG